VLVEAARWTDLAGFMPDVCGDIAGVLKDPEHRCDSTLVSARGSSCGDRWSGARSTGDIGLLSGK
jgi:hypothetical protein